MRQIVILSGKGGTGKTSFTSAITSIMKAGVIADCDVDAADMFLILTPEELERHDFLGGKTAVINKQGCTGCNKCYEVCRFNAVKIKNGEYSINPYACDGCGFCVRVCPTKTIDFVQNTAGVWFISKTRFGKLVHAKLKPGEENSGKLVTMVRHQARLIAEEENKNLIIIDGPPGIGCPVISALSGVDDVIILTEPTKSGLSDLKRMAKTAKHFNLPVAVIINKYNLNDNISNEIESYCNDRKYKFLGKIPFDDIFVKAMLDKKSVIEYDKNSIASKEIIKIAKNINIDLKEEFL